MNASLKDELEAAMELLRLVRAERDELAAHFYKFQRLAKKDLQVAQTLCMLCFAWRR